MLSEIALLAVLLIDQDLRTEREAAALPQKRKIHEVQESMEDRLWLASR